MCHLTLYPRWDSDVLNNQAALTDCGDRDFVCDGYSYVIMDLCVCRGVWMTCLLFLILWFFAALASHNIHNLHPTHQATFWRVVLTHTSNIQHSSVPTNVLFCHVSS